MSLYLLYKIVRRDLSYWIRLEGIMNVVGSVLERAIVKILVDFTGVLQFR
jgi:hypothetical protein